MNKSLILVVLILVILLVLTIDYFLKKRNKKSDKETLTKKKFTDFLNYSKGIYRINKLVIIIWTIVGFLSFFNNSTGYNVFKYKVINNTVFPENFDANRLISLDNSIELIENKIEKTRYRKFDLFDNRSILIKKRRELLKGLAFSSTLDNIWDIYIVDTFFTYCLIFQLLYLVAFYLIIPIIQKIIRWILDGFKNSTDKGIVDNKI